MGVRSVVLINQTIGAGVGRAKALALRLIKIDNFRLASTLISTRPQITFLHL